MDMKTCKSWLIHQRFSDDLPRNSEIVSMFNWLIAAVESLTAKKEAAEKFLRMANEDTEFYKKLNRENCGELESSLAQAREEIERLKEHRDSVLVADKWKYGEINRLEDALKAAEQREKGLREALEKLARLGNEPHLGNSDGNMIAQAALAAASTKGEKTMNEPCEGCNSAPVDCKGLSVCADKWKAKAQYLERYKSVVENQLLPMMATERTLRLEAEGDCGGDEVAESVEKLLNEARAALAAASKEE